MVLFRSLGIFQAACCVDDLLIPTPMISRTDSKHFVSTDETSSYSYSYLMYVIFVRNRRVFDLDRRLVQL